MRRGGSRGEDLRSVANKVAVSRPRMRGQRERPERVIHRVCQIAQRVEQGAIEIEEDAAGHGRFLSQDWREV